MKPNFPAGYPLQKRVICCKNGKRRNKNKKAGGPWTGNIGLEQDIYV